MAPPTLPESATLEDLLQMYWTSPSSWRPVLYLYHALGESGQTTGGTLSPYTLPAGTELDEQVVWRELARRLGAPGRAVVRLHPADGSNIRPSVGVTLTDPLWQMYRPQAQQQAAPPPSFAAPAAQQAAHPPMDLMTLLLTSMQQQQQTLMNLITRAPAPDPAVAIMQAEIARLSRQLEDAQRKPAERSKEEKEELMALGKELAGGGGMSSAAVTLLTGPVDRLAGAIEKIVDARAKVSEMEAMAKLREVETKQLEAATRAAEAGVDVESVGGTEAAATPTPTTSTPQ